MKSKILPPRIFIFFLLSLFFIKPSFGGAIAGGEITYQCKGNGKYDVFVRVYRDCNGIQLSAANLTAQCSSTTVAVTGGNQTLVSTRDITNFSPQCSTLSRCSGSFPYGFQEVTWKMELDLSSYACCEWTLSWQSMGRASNITTGAASQNFYIFATLNKCLSSCNSAPIFVNPPDMVLCHNRDVYMKLGALDTIDTGDSLSYHLVSALQGMVQNVTYSGQYSPTRPLNFFGFPNQNLPAPAGFHLNPNTGDLRFRPTVLSQMTIVVIEVKEWREVNGVQTVVGVTRRDLGFIVIACPNNMVPTISGPDTYNACVGEELCITIQSADTNTNDTVKLNWDHGIANATFTTNNGNARLASGQVCWTPTIADTSGSVPHSFLIEAYDNACPFAARSVKDYTVSVSLKPEGTMSRSLLSCGQVAVDYINQSQMSGVNFTYLVKNASGNTVITSTQKVDTFTLNPGKYYLDLVMTSSAPCTTVEHDSFFIANYVQVELPMDTTLCSGDSISLMANITNASMPYSMEWWDRTGNQQLSSGTNQWKAAITSDRHIEFRVHDNAGCSHSDSIFITANPLPQLNLGNDRAFCSGDTLVLDAGGDSLAWTYDWNTGATTKLLPVWVANEYSLVVTDSFGCGSSDTIEVFENTNNQNQIPDSSICEGDIHLIQLNQGDSARIYDFATYATNPTLLYQGNQIYIPVNQTRTYIAERDNYLLGSVCTGLDTFTLTALPKPPVDLGFNRTICSGDSVRIGVSDSSAFTYLWSNGEVDSRIWVKSAGTYILEVASTNGCADSDSLQVFENNVNLTLSNDQDVCDGAMVHLGAAGATTYSWYDSANYVYNGTNTPVSNSDSLHYVGTVPTTWIVMGEKLASGIACYTFDTVRVSVKAAPQVAGIVGNQFPTDTTQTYQYSVSGTGISSYSWTVINGTLLSGQNTATASVQWNNQQNCAIYVEVSNANQCTDDTVLLVHVMPTSVELPLKEGVRVYPNPSKDFFTIELDNYENSLNYTLYDQLGKAVKQGELKDKLSQVSIEDLKPGVYVLSIEGMGMTKLLVSDK